MYLETKNWVLGMLIATGVSLLWGPFSGHIYKYTHTYIHLYFYPSLYLSLCEISSSYSWFKIKSNDFYVSGCSCLLLFLSPQSMGFPEGLDFLPCAWLTCRGIGQKWRKTVVACLPNEAFKNFKTVSPTQESKVVASIFSWSQRVHAQYLLSPKIPHA